MSHFSGLAEYSIRIEFVGNMADVQVMNGGGETVATIPMPRHEALALAPFPRNFKQVATQSPEAGTY